MSVNENPFVREKKYTATPSISNLPNKNVSMVNRIHSLISRVSSHSWIE